MKTLNKALNFAVSKFSRGPLEDAWTEYLSWLSFANAGMLSRGNVDCFDYALKHLPSSSPILEIGSFCGLSTNAISYLKHKNGVSNPLITCDRWVFEGAENGGNLSDSSVTHAKYRDFVRETFVRNVKMFSDFDLPYTLEMFSDELFEQWNSKEECIDIFDRSIQLGSGISFCYIDGNHTYQYAKNDFENCDRHLDKGGFVLFDDSADGSEWEVCRVVKEVRASGRYELVAKAPNYFFQKKENLV